MTVFRDRGASREGLLSPYREVLAVPGIRLVLVSGLLGRMPIGMVPLGILLLVRAATGSYAAAGIAVGASAVMAGLVGPVLGRLVDVVGRQRVLVPAAFAQPAAVIALVLAAERGASAVMLVALAGLCGAARSPLPAVSRVILTEAVARPSARESAYSLDAVTQDVTWTMGPLLVAVLVTVASPEVALLAAVALGGPGCLAFALSPLVRGGGRYVTRKRGGALRSAALRAVLPLAFAVALGMGITEVALVALAADVGGDHLAGVLVTAWSVGSLIGGLAYGTRRWSSDVDRRFAVLLLLLSVCTLPLVLVASLGSAIVFAFVVGLPFTPAFVCQLTLIGRAAPAGTETEAFTWQNSSAAAGLASGTGLGGVLLEHVGIDASFLAAAAITAVAAGYVGLRAPWKHRAKQDGSRECVTAERML